MGKSSLLRTVDRMDTRILVFFVRTVQSSGFHIPANRIHRFAGDFLAGMTVASMLIPQSVSYASSLAKLSPVTGLVCFLLS